MKPTGGFATGNAGSLGGFTEWFSAQDLAEQALPGLPKVKRKINERAEAERWALKFRADGSPMARPRAGRGGGTEYHIDVLPPAARQALVKRGLIAAPVEEAPANVTALPITPSARWAWYETLPASAKTRAVQRARIIDRIEQLERHGMTRTAAVASAAKEGGNSTSTLWNWLDLIAGCSPHDRLPALAPRCCAGGKEAEIDEQIWLEYRSDYLRPKPTHSACYDRVRRIAAERGIEIPHAVTFRRRIERDIPAAVRVATRSGPEAVAKLIPAQRRSVEAIAAMEVVNIDGHKWDVFVRWPDGRIARPMMIAIQDVYSRKMLAWRIGQTESAVETRLCFADLFRDHGIPKAVLMDNGRAFASKWISGGAKTRFRFKVKEDEPLGLLTQLGIENMWATPYHGQSKPIERAFRDLETHAGTHPEFAGAGTGNTIANKPHDYGSKTVEFAVFKRIIAQEIAAHNARPGRDTDACKAGGLSFDQAYDRSIAAGAPVGVATEAQMRLALLTAERVTADRQTGMIRIADNAYWCEGLSSVAGQRLTIRFDPDNLHSEVFAYDAKGAFVARVPIYERTGFRDMGAAKDRARTAAAHRKSVAEAVRHQRLLTAQDLAARMPGAVAPEPRQTPKVVRPHRVRGNAAVAIAEAPPAEDFWDRIAGGRAVTETRPGLRLVE